MVTLNLAPETEARLRETAERDGRDIDTVADLLLAAALEWEAQDRAEAIAGIQRGLDASAAGRVRPAADVFAEMRVRLSATHP